MSKRYHNSNFFSEMFVLSFALLCLVKFTQGYMDEVNKDEDAPLGARQSYSRVVNGNIARQGQFPYQVSLQHRNMTFFGVSHFCGGSIISPIWILTAAHCVDGVTAAAFQVVAGENNIRIDEGTEQRIDVANIAMHPGYKGLFMGDDITLLKLAWPIFYNEYAQPITLATTGPEGGEYCIISGWGTTLVGYDRSIPDRLQFAPLPVVDLRECQEKGLPGALINQDNVCTQPMANGMSPCVLDSGGPLACHGLLSGVVSFGHLYCGKANTMNVYTRVSAYQNWIRDTILALTD